MKKLSDFKDEKSIEIVAELMEPILAIATSEKNIELKDETNAFKMFSGFMKNSPREMMNIFAILSEEDPEVYHCNAAEALANTMELITDEELLKLFISQGQTGDATSSASASENTEELKK